MISGVVLRSRNNIYNIAKAIVGVCSARRPPPERHQDQKEIPTRSPGPLVRWSFGPLVRWSRGPSVSWSAGLLLSYSAGPLLLRSLDPAGT